MEIEEAIRPFQVPAGTKISLRKDYDPGYKGDHLKKKEANELLQQGIQDLATHQDMLYAQNTYALLLIFQAMDAAGKDGTIKHVMSGVNPQGCEVCSFKAPSAEELDHDYLWRCSRRLPERGRIGIFNRSYYEEVLVVRVHPEILAAQRTPAAGSEQGHLEAPLRGHQRLRAAPGRQRHCRAQVLPQRLERGAEETFPRAASIGRRRTGSSPPAT